jgi:hypothetical protein
MRFFLQNEPNLIGLEGLIRLWQSRPMLLVPAE